MEYLLDINNIDESMLSKLKIHSPIPIQGGSYLAKLTLNDNPILFQMPKCSTKKGIINKVYHLVRFYQFYKKRSIIRRVSNKKTGKILDIGCGTGDFLKYMHSSGWETDGVETDLGAKLIAEKKLGKKIEENFAQIKGEKKYDVISMWHVLEHVYNLEGYLKKVNKLLKKGGVLVVGVPNCASYDAKKYKEN